jgi:hypothetical protein
MTVADPAAIVSGVPTHTSMSPDLAAGMPAISTVGHPGGKIGPPTCGTGPGSAIGQVCMSPTRAAGGMTFVLSSDQPHECGTWLPSGNSNFNPCDGTELIRIGRPRSTNTMSIGMRETASTGGAGVTFSYPS